MYNYKIQLCPLGFQWHITRFADGKHWTIDNSQQTIILEGCQLRPQTEEMPYILCKRLKFDLKESKAPKGQIIHCTYNISPTWILDGKDVDMRSFTVLQLYGRDVYSERSPEKSLEFAVAGEAPIELYDGCIQHLLVFNEN